MGNRALWHVQFSGREMGIDAIIYPVNVLQWNITLSLKSRLVIITNITSTIFLIYIVVQFWLKESHLWEYLGTQANKFWDTSLPGFWHPSRSLTWLRNKTNAHRMGQAHTNIWSLKPGLQEDFYLVICVSLARKIGKNHKTRCYIIRAFFSLS